MSWSLTSSRATGTVATPNTIGVIGDSTTLMNNNGPTLVTNALAADGWDPANVQVKGVYGMKIDATSGTPSNSTNNIVDTWRAGGFDPRVWLMASGINDAFGTNTGSPYFFDSVRGPAVQDVYNHIMAGPRTDYQVYWMSFDFYDTGYSRYPEATAFDTVTLPHFVATYSNFHEYSMINYYTPMRSNPSWNSWWNYPADHVHNTTLGYSTIRAPAYALAVTGAKA